MKGKVEECDGVAVLPPEAGRREIPYMAVRILMGARVHKDYKGHKDSVALESEGRMWPLSGRDFERASRVAEEAGRMVEAGRIPSGEQVMALHRAASEVVERDVEAPTKKVAMLKDSAGSGYWRMVLPARHMDLEGLSVDVTAAPARYEHLTEYDTVYVQRLHDWESYYLLEKLRSAGKRIVYDVDDEIFSIPADNPACRLIGKDEQTAALACMRIADCVTTTTSVLQYRLTQLLGGASPVVVPNALDPDAGWFPDGQTGSPDGWKRMFWQGSATHASDWMECVEAVDDVMRAHEKVRMVILGYLPPAVQERLGEPHWRGRVEYVGFSSPEAYFEIAKRVKADVGLAPLRESYFNDAKSNIKWLEYAMMGMPAAASDCGPYRDTIDDGCDGMLCSNREEWTKAIERALFEPGEARRMVGEARRKARAEYDVREVAKTWRRVLLGEP